MAKVTVALIHRRGPGVVVTTRDRILLSADDPDPLRAALAG